MDLISELPEPILHHILNFVLTKDVARVSCVSKGWRGMTSSYATVNLIQDFFKQPNTFLDFMENSLQRCVARQLGVQRFKLHITSDEPGLYDLIGQWIDFVGSSSRLQEVRIDIDRTLSPYCFPAEILQQASKTLTTLSLVGCELGNLAATSINLPRLQNLMLLHSEVDDTSVHNLISACPSLVYLTIMCRGLTSLEVSHLQSLKSIEVGCCLELGRVRVRASSLESLFVGESTSLGRIPCQIDLAASVFSSLKSLLLSSTKVTGEWLQNHIPEFVGLESLLLSHIEAVETLRISSPKLNKLTIRGCGDLGATTEIDAPNLQALNYTYNKLPFYTVTTSNLKNVFFHFQPGDHFNVFEDLLKKTTHLQDMKVAILWNDERILTHELELNDSVVAFKDSRIMIATMTSAEWFAFLLAKGSHWENMCIATNGGSSDFLRAFHEQISKKKVQAHRALDNNGLDIDCWRYYLEDLEIGNINWAKEKQRRVDKSWIKLLKAYEKLYHITSVNFEWVLRPGCNGCRCVTCLHCEEIKEINKSCLKKTD